MKYPLKILKNQLKDVEDAMNRCLKNDNYLDHLNIEQDIEIPLRNAIRLIEMAVENELKFNVVIK